MQVDAPVTLVVPAAQGVQDAEPTPLYVPAAPGEPVEPAALDVPAGQDEHGDAYDHPATLVFPAAQGVQDNPSIPYVPGAHETQSPLES